MQRMEGGCEYVGCPFAGLDATRMLLQLHPRSIYACTQETNKKVKDSAVTLAGFQVHLASHFSWCDARCVTGWSTRRRWCWEFGKTEV